MANGLSIVLAANDRYHKSVLPNVRVRYVNQRLYSLEVNGELICEVTAETPAWLPVKPELDRRWLRDLVKLALDRYFARGQNLAEHEVVRA
jgi:hypothetical protein